MKKFISMLFIFMMASIMALTISSCAHRSGHSFDRTSQSVVYSAEDTAFVLSLASSLGYAQFNNADEYIIYREQKDKVDDADKIISSLDSEMVEKLAKISIHEYGEVNDILVAGLYKEHRNILKYIDSEGTLHLDDVPCDSGGIKEYSTFKPGGGIE